MSQNGLRLERCASCGLVSGFVRSCPLSFGTSLPQRGWVGGAGQRLAASQERNRSDKQTARGECQQDDGVAIGSLSCGRSSGGVIAALSTALCVGGAAGCECSG